jgi:hypothetical protein
MGIAAAKEQEGNEITDFIHTIKSSYATWGSLFHRIQSWKKSCRKQITG